MCVTRLQSGGVGQDGDIKLTVPTEYLGHHWEDCPQMKRCLSDHSWLSLTDFHKESAAASAQELKQTLVKFRLSR